MPPRFVEQPFAAVLARAGFDRRIVARDSSGEIDVYRRPTVGHWFIEARQEGEGDGYLDVGLTIDVEGGALMGPVHRALSVGALASALPDIIASLDTLARAADSLRCTTCNSRPHMKHGPSGPFLACGQATSRKPFDTSTRPCRQHLVMASLIVHDAPDQP